jgi:hypothetical protein
VGGYHRLEPSQCKELWVGLVQRHSSISVFKFDKPLIRFARRWLPWVLGIRRQVWQLPIDKPELADMLQRGDRGTQDLSDNEHYRYVLFQGTTLRSFEQYFALHELGTLSDAQWAGWERPLSQNLQYPGVRQVWEAALRGQHTKGFTELVDGLICNSPETHVGELFARSPNDS